MGVVIDVILPALNEALALPHVIKGLPTGYRAIVVDNGSTDDTMAVADALGATVVHEPRPGYGAAVHAGVLRADSDVIAVMDADGSLDAQELPRLVDLLTVEDADLAIGRRRPTSRKAWPWHARLGNRLVAHRLRHTLGVRLHDIGPMRVCHRTALIDLEILDRRFGYPIETVIRAAGANWRILECDVTYGPRAEGTHSKVTGSVTGTAKAVRDFYKVMS